MGEPVEDAGRVEVAGAGGVDDAVDRVGRDRRAACPALITTEPCAPRVSAAISQCASTPLGRLVEVVDLVEHRDLVLVGEQHVDVGLDQLEELGAVALDAERIGERERDPAAGLARERRGRGGSRPSRRPRPRGSPRGT